MGPTLLVWITVKSCSGWSVSTCLILQSILLELEAVEKAAVQIVLWHHCFGGCPEAQGFHGLWETLVSICLCDNDVQTAWPAALLLQLSAVGHQGLMTFLSEGRCWEKLVMILNIKSWPLKGINSTLSKTEEMIWND